MSWSSSPSIHLFGVESMSVLFFPVESVSPEICAWLIISLPVVSSDITLNDTLITDKKTYKYSIKSISEEYFSDNNETYQEVVLNINLDNKYKYNNLVLNLKLLKEDKMVIEYLKELGGIKWLN